MMKTEMISLNGKKYKSVRINDDLYIEEAFCSVLQELEDMDRMIPLLDGTGLALSVSRLDPTTRDGAAEYFRLLALHGVFMHPDDPWADFADPEFKEKPWREENCRLLDEFVEKMMESLGDDAYEIGMAVWAERYRMHEEARAGESASMGACYTDIVLEDLAEAELITALRSAYPEELGSKYGRNAVRICDVCGKVMSEGWMDNYSDFHACSDECLRAYYLRSPGGEEELRGELERGDVFYTEWGSPFYGE